jgi:hypothetical protein
VFTSFSVLRGKDQERDRIQFTRLGTAPTGFPVMETTRKTEAGKTSVSTIELLGFSEAPLDAALFERPGDYAEAKHTPHGGYDMTQPDTLSNRLHVYWAELTDSVRNLL